MLEVLEKYGQGFILYVGWFLGDNRKHPQIKPLDLLEDERLLICSLMCLVGGLSLYYLLLTGDTFKQDYLVVTGKDFKQDMIMDAVGKRLVAWAGVVLIANVVALLFGMQSRVLDVTSSILRVVPIVSLMNPVFGFEVFKIAGLFHASKQYALLLMLMSMSAFALLANLLAMPRSLALVEGSKPLSAWTIVAATSMFMFAIDADSIRRFLGGLAQ